MIEYEELVYARGFLITQGAPIGVPGHWATVKLGQWSFYFDPIVPLARSGETAIFGHAVDLSDERRNLREIAEAADSLTGNPRQDYLDQLAGRYLVIQRDGDAVRIQQDATGLRAVYYTESMYRFVAGSHQHLVASQVNAPHGYFGGSFLRENSMEAYPGRATKSVGVVRQLPNTELDSASRRTERVFPRSFLEPCTVDEAAQVVIEASDTQLRAHGGPLMSSLSAGLDSRVTMALLRGHLNRTTFFTYEMVDRPHNEGNRHDRTGAIELAEKFGLDHKMLLVSAIEDRAFEAAMMKNTPLPHGRAIAKAYLDVLPTDALHIRSNLFEIGRCYYRNMGMGPSKVAAQAMRYIIANGRSFDLPTFDAFEEYLHMTEFENATKLGYDGLDLFYWEHRMGSWMTPVLHESDIAHETHVLINARTILQKLLGVPIEDRATGAAFKRVIAMRWPELADVPVNGEMLDLDITSV